MLHAAVIAITVVLPPPVAILQAYREEARVAPLAPLIARLVGGDLDPLAIVRPRLPQEDQRLRRLELGEEEALPPAVASPPVHQLAGHPGRSGASVRLPLRQPGPDLVYQREGVGPLVVGEALQREVARDVPGSGWSGGWNTSAGRRPLLRSGGWPGRRNQCSAGGSNGELRIGVSTSKDI